MNNALLESALNEFDLKLDSKSIERFTRFMDELKRWNRSINLTAIKQDNQIIIKHFADSLSIVPHLAQHSSLLDIGSGAGMPSIPVAILRNDLEITSIDAVDKKVRFQRHICRMLEIGNVNVLHKRAEEMPDSEEALFDIVTSRAFRNIEQFIHLSHRLVRPGGQLIAMMAGSGNQLPDKMDAIMARYGLNYLQSVRYSLPMKMGERHLLLVQRNSL